MQNIYLSETFAFLERPFAHAYRAECSRRPADRSTTDRHRVKVACRSLSAPDRRPRTLILVSAACRRTRCDGGKLRALVEELHRFPGAYLGGLLDIWIRQFGRPGSVGRILIRDVEVRQNRRSAGLAQGGAVGAVVSPGGPLPGGGSLRCAIARQRESCRVSPASYPGESANGALSGWSVDP